jgi:DNA-binding NarL/FixJ family response regulator
MFNDLAGWLMLHGESTVLVLELPAIDTFRRAVLKEVRRLAPGIGVVALAKAVTPEVQRDAEAAHVARVVPTDASPEEIATAAELARKDAQTVTAGREPVLEEEPE